MIAGARRLLGHSRDEALVAGVRRRDRRAFEAIYERHAAQLLTFCMYLLGSRHDAEDALQATFASAYRALLNDTRPVSLRPWLFTIARNESLSILRKRRPQVELNGEVALTGDPVKLAEVHEEMVSMIGGIRELPEKQRAALVLAEVHGMSHAEIGSVLGVRPEQVKAFVFQARSNLLSDRHAREVDCREIREELATSRGLVSKRARLRRHLRSCDACRAYADGVERQHRQIASLLPILPSLTIKYRAIDQALQLCGSDAANYANSASMAGTALEVAGGGMTALVAKVATGIVAVGASAGVGMTVIDTPTASHSRPAAVVRRAGSGAELASTAGRGTRLGYTGSVSVDVGAGQPGHPGTPATPRQRAAAAAKERPEREGRGERVGSLRDERNDGGGSGAGGAGASGASGPSAALTALQERRLTADERREQRSEALEERQHERKEAHQPATVEVAPTEPPRHTHTGSGPVHVTSEGKSGGSGSKGSKSGSESGREHEHIHAQNPNKGRKHWEEVEAERKKRREERAAERKKHRQEHRQPPGPEPGTPEPGQ